VAGGFRVQIDESGMFSEGGSDLLPAFRTKLSMISSKEKGAVYVEEQAHGSANDRGFEASRGWAEGRGRSAKVGLWDIRRETTLRLRLRLGADCLHSHETVKDIPPTR
jgi:hypothetical protein